MTDDNEAFSLTGVDSKRYQEACVDECARRSHRGPFYSCSTRPTIRGDWDYCR